MNKKKGNLIILWNYLEWGGAQIYFLAIIKEAVKNWNVTVALPRESSADIISFIEETGVEYKFLETKIDNSPANGLIKKLRRQWRRIHAEFTSLLFILKYPRRKTIVHVETAPWQSWIFLTLLALRGGVFVTVHNALSKTSKWRETIWRFRLKFLSGLKNFHILTANLDAKANLKPYVLRDFEEKIKVTYASINPQETSEVLQAKIDKERLFQKQKIPPGKFTVLCAGQFIDRKGRWIFLEAAEIILRQNSDILFVWLMPRLPDDEAQKKIDSFNLKNSFFPVLSASVGTKRREILEFFTIADLFVLPSLLEGLPISLLEAMALNKACIASNINSIPEAVRHLETGWLIEPERASELAEAVLALKNDENLRKNLADKARSFVTEHFDERKMAKKVTREYENSFN